MSELLTLLTLSHTFPSTHIAMDEDKNHLQIVKQNFWSGHFLQGLWYAVIFKVSIALLIQVPNVHQMPNINAIYNLSSTFVISQFFFCFIN